MTQEEYIELHPEQFKDDIDKWLFKEFSILGGCCSAEKSHEYAVARMVAEKQLELLEKNRLAHCDALTKEQAQIESDFVVNHLKKNQRIPTFIDAIEYGMKLKEEEMQSTIELAEEHAMLAGMNKMEQQMMAKAVDGVCSLELGDLGAVRTTTGFKLNGLHCGDKVKLIIIKVD